MWITPGIVVFALFICPCLCDKEKSAHSTYTSCESKTATKPASTTHTSIYSVVSSSTKYSTLSPPSGSFVGSGGLTTRTTTPTVSSLTSKSSPASSSSTRTTGSTLIVSPSTLTTKTSSKPTSTTISGTATAVTTRSTSTTAVSPTAMTTLRSTTMTITTGTTTSTRSSVSSTTKLTTTTTTTTTTFSNFGTTASSPSSTPSAYCGGNSFLNPNFGGYDSAAGPRLEPWKYWSSPNVTSPSFAPGYNTPFSVNLSTDASGGYRGVDQTIYTTYGYNYTFSFDYLVARNVPPTTDGGQQNVLFCLNGSRRDYTVSISLAPAPKGVWLHSSELVTIYDSTADWKCNLIAYSEAEIHVTNFAFNCTGMAS